MSFLNPKPWKGRIPKDGDKVDLLDGFYETMPDGVEAAKMARLPYATVDGHPLVLTIGQDGDYEETYEIYIKETPYMVGLYNQSWKFHEEK